MSGSAGVKADQIRRGQVIAAPRSIRPRARFRAEVYALRKDEGGRHTPFFGGYKPQFYVRTTDVTGVVALGPGVDMVMPGDNARIEVSLDRPIACAGGGQPVRAPRGRQDGRKRCRERGDGLTQWRCAGESPRPAIHFRQRFVQFATGHHTVQRNHRRGKHSPSNVLRARGPRSAVEAGYAPA